MDDHYLSPRDLAKRMKAKHGCGSFNTIAWWMVHGAANRELFEMAIDCINEFETNGWKVKRLSPLTVDAFEE